MASNADMETVMPLPEGLSEALSEPAAEVPSDVDLTPAVTESSGDVGDTGDDEEASEIPMSETEARADSTPPSAELRVLNREGVVAEIAAGFDAGGERPHKVRPVGAVDLDTAEDRRIGRHRMLGRPPSVRE